jgi:endonuclease-3
MLFSLRKEVFPVDTHCWRISKRLGWLETKGKSEFCTSSEMDELQEMIPPELRFSLHVNLVSLGREFCSARLPKCSICPIERYCLKLGVVEAIN